MSSAERHIYKTYHTSVFACIIIVIIVAYVCRHIIVDSGTTVTFLSDTHRLAQSSSQPLHPRHEDYRSGIFCNIQMMFLKCLSTVNIMFKVMLFLHRKNRARGTGLESHAAKPSGEEETTASK